MSRRDVFLWLIFALILAFFISPFASRFPDGLEKVAKDESFLKKGEIKSVFISPVPGYTWPGIDKRDVATGIAGVFGTLVVFGIAYGIGALLRGKRDR